MSSPLGQLHERIKHKEGFKRSKAIPKKPLEGLQKHFRIVKDRRKEKSKEHRLIDIVKHKVGQIKMLLPSNLLRVGKDHAPENLAVLRHNYSQFLETKKSAKGDIHAR